MTPEFSRPERLDAIGGDPRAISIAADAAERAALARRFGLPGIESLAADLTIRRVAAGIMVEGRIRAALTQACAITGDPLPVTLDEPVALRFVEEQPDMEEIDLDSDAVDTVAIEGGAIDLGEVAAETMALALDPFPRGPRAEAALREAGILREEDVKPANAFAALADRMKSN